MSRHNPYRIHKMRGTFRHDDTAARSRSRRPVFGRPDHLDEVPRLILQDGSYWLIAAC